MPSLKIYTMHHPSLIERKEHVLLQLKKYGLETEFITSHNPEDFATDQNIWNYIFQKFDLQIKTHNGQGPMTLPKASLFMKQMDALYQFINSNEDYVLLFEDDVILHSDFLNILNECFFKFFKKLWILVGIF